MVIIVIPEQAGIYYIIEPLWIPFCNEIAKIVHLTKCPILESFMNLFR